VSGLLRRAIGLLPPVIAVLGAGLVALLLVMAVGENPLHAARVVIGGIFGSADEFASALFNTTALIFTGLSVAFAFRAGLFNIGAEGQLTVGAFLATMAALHLGGLPAVLLVPICMATAALGGAVWGAIPGLLRARLGVHEVVNTIMMNFIASGLTGYLTVYVFKEPGQMIPHTSRIPEAARIARLGDLPGSPLPATSPANVALLLAIALAVICALVLSRTAFGFRVRALGAGAAAARTAGMPTAATLVGAMAVAGALAGLAGVNEVMGFRYRFLDNFTGGVGFLGIAVALLGRVRMSGVVAAAFLFGVLGAGAVELDLSTEVPRELVLVVQAALLLFVVAADEGARRWLRARAGEA
jgi:simple sugar transport system permease protein